jgi:glutamate--cysteine ligase
MGNRRSESIRPCPGPNSVSPLTAEELRVAIERQFTPPPDSDSGPGLTGVELELIPRRVSPGGTIESVPLATVLEVVGCLTTKSGFRRLSGDRPAFTVGNGGSLTFEPGGQIEYSGPPMPTAREAGADLRSVLGPLKQTFSAAGIELQDAGITPAGSAGLIELQQPNRRYEVMDSYLSGISPWGPLMMRGTASMQINIDLGAPEQVLPRWRAANLLAPVLGGAFANSPLRIPDGSRAASGRLWIWPRIDPSRTGFVLPSRGEDLVDTYLGFALGAAVMLRGSGTDLQAADRRSFEEWIAEPGDRPPEYDDWITHLTTLFPHVRPRSWIEVRFVDTPREDWWDVPLVIFPALLYDDVARSAVISLLSPNETRLEALTETAALSGVADPEIGALAETVFEIALDAVERMPADYFGANQVSAAVGFLSRFTSRRLSQADESVRAGG